MRLQLFVLYVLMITAGAAHAATPQIDKISVNGKVKWQAGHGDPAPTLKPGQLVVLQGQGFGKSATTYIKIMIGPVRVLERDLYMLPSKISLTNVFEGKSAYEETLPDGYNRDGSPYKWSKDLLAWSDTSISFHVPVTASRGPLVVQTQAKIGTVPAPAQPGTSQKIPDPILERVDNQPAASLTIAQLGAPAQSAAIPVQIDNPGFNAMADEGAKIYWGFDYNIGPIDQILGINWNAIFNYQAIDSVTNRPFDPYELIGAIKLDPNNAQQVPSAGKENIHFASSPMPSPIARLFKDDYAVDTKPTGWVGYVNAKVDVLPAPLQSYRIGFNCASCHARQLTYDAGNGQQITRVFNGIPNPKWSMKFTTAASQTGARMLGLSGFEKTEDGTKFLDKTMVLYNVPTGTADMSLARSNLIDSENFYHNDFLFSPAAIPIITNHTPVRRALSRSEAIAGFEGSYIHSEEPDGAMGAHTKSAVQNLTAYLSTMDQDHDLLVKLGIYRWLKFKNHLDEVGEVSEGQFLNASVNDYPTLQNHISRGAAVFQSKCASCHASNFGTHTDENMMPLSQIGTYFSPTVWERQMASLRTAMIREVFWVQSRGLLHDGHVRSSDPEHLDSLALLLGPDRCNTSSALYKQMYTLNASSFRIAKGTSTQETATRAHHYFVDLPGADREQAKYLYWDYQKMRREFGPREFGSTAHVALPATPHAYCVDQDEVDDLVHYLLTL